MGGDDNWDLYAVVRGCRSSATRDPLSSIVAKPEPRAEPEFTGFSSRFGECDDGVRELEELCRPFCFSSSKQEKQLQVQTLLPPQQQTVAIHRPTQRALSAGQIPRSKRRKNQQKKVICHVPADDLSSDLWAWRKYGQKPIKGSPYPRGYYRCSSSKGCPARKQLERSRNDSKMFIVTYTAEHNHPMPTHRNSLSGISRHKFSITNEEGAGNIAVAAGLSPTTPLTAAMEEELKAKEADEEEDEEAMLSVEDMEFMGEDEFLFLEDEDSSAAEATFDGEQFFAPLRASGGS